MSKRRQNASCYFIKNNVPPVNFKTSTGTMMRSVVKVCRLPYNVLVVYFYFIFFHLFKFWLIFGYRC